MLYLNYTSILKKGIKKNLLRLFLQFQREVSGFFVGKKKVNDNSMSIFSDVGPCSWHPIKMPPKSKNSKHRMHERKYAYD